MNINPLELEKKLGIDFKNKNLLKQALSHSSYSNEKGQSHIQSNERLEFLGDAVLEIVASEVLYYKYKNKNEGALSKIRASLVCEPTLSECSRKIDLPKYILLGKGEEKSGGRERDSIISDCMEALIGAIYLDRGIACAKDFIMEYILDDIENVSVFSDNKTHLQELIQARGNVPCYELIKEEGPSHNKIFTVCVKERDEVLGVGVGRTKKAAEQEAAKEAIKVLKETEKHVS